MQILISISYTQCAKRSKAKYARNGRHCSRRNLLQVLFQLDYRLSRTIIMGNCNCRRHCNGVKPELWKLRGRYINNSHRLQEFRLCLVFPAYQKIRLHPTWRSESQHHAKRTHECCTTSSFVKQVRRPCSEMNSTNDG